MKRNKDKNKRLKRRIKNLLISLAVLFCSICIICTSSVIDNIVITSSGKVKEIAVIENSDVFTVCLDAGHGDWDVGAIGINSSLEKDIVLSITLETGKLLEEAGVNVVYTRKDDTLTWSDNSTENLYERVNISEENNSDLFISIHCNSTDESSSYKGVETWYNPNSIESEEFAEYIQRELINKNYTEDRGIKYYSSDAPLAVLNHNSATAALIELGFISNLSDENYLTSKSGQATIAKSISEAVLKYKSTLE